MRIAVVGAGVSGLVAAYLLHREHELTLFEANDYLGGHTNTVRVETDFASWNVDTGFIVLNDRNYPNFTRLLHRLGVATQATHMGFSVKGDVEDFEYAGTPRGVFCQRGNLARPAFWRMIGDLLRFNRELRALLDHGHHHRHHGNGNGALSLGDYLISRNYSRPFIDRLIVPQASAVWSADPKQMWSFPVRFLAEFFHNHGMLGFADRPRWSTVVGGSARYVEALVRPFRDRVRLATPISAIRRHADHVELTPAGGEPQRFDQVILACHSDQALAMLSDPSEREARILGALPYQLNEAVLHTDAAMLPRRRAARQAWNFHLLPEPAGMTTITYYMNHLQRLDADRELCVTLNMTDRIDPQKIIRKIPYAHPVYTHTGVAAQARHEEISGRNRTHYCGAYWGWGFHEDGVVSALRALRPLGATL